MRKDIFKLGLRLMLIAFLATAVLAATNLFTKDRIEEQAQIKAQAARQAVMPGQSDFAGEATKDDTVQSVYSCPGGYVITVAADGYSGNDIAVTVGIGRDGAITGVGIDASTQTPGLGAKCGDEAYSSQYTGLSAAELDQVDAVTAATISSEAAKGAVRTALDYFETHLN